MLLPHLDSPPVVFVLALVAQGVAAFVGDLAHRRKRSLRQGERHYFDTIQAATLTLMALIIGFTFSMAVNRYDHRSTQEAAESSAIGTAYLRAALLPGDVASRTQELLKKYLDLRVAFYEEGNAGRATEILNQTALVQNELWSAVTPAAASQQTPVMALVLSGINDVINSQGSTRAAWSDRIPGGAWAMMGLMAIICNLLVGYSERHTGELYLFVLPLIVSIAFFLIADLENPRGGVIQVQPQNLFAALQSMKTPQGP